jgi:hypothetical protein
MKRSLLKVMIALPFVVPVVRGQAQPPAQPIKRLPHTTSWVGNSFAGDGGPNGSGFWVQNGADEIEVTPDGTVFAGVEWDEAGRCAGLYKDRRVNRVLLKEQSGNGKESAWGFGTANNAVAVSGDRLYVANTGKKLLRFQWTPGEIDSARFVDEANLSALAVGLAARGDKIAVVYRDHLELLRASDLATIASFPVADARDAAIAVDGSLWVLAGKEIRRLAPDGKDSGIRVPGLENPSALSLDPQNHLLVCDDGPRQQVLTFDVSSTPKLIATFGALGGLRSGTPGLAAPQKLFSPRGAGRDEQGNLYVALGFSGAPSGNCFLRSFDPSGKIRWELMSTAFVDTFGFDPNSDGSVIYSRTAIFDLDLTRTTPGTEAKLRSITLDHVENPGDDRIKNGCSTLMRHLQGKRVLYTIGQYGGGYHIYTFTEPDGQIAREVDRIHPDGETWAWDIDDDGGIWHGDAAGQSIHYFPFNGWQSDGKPDYSWKNPSRWPWPADFAIVRRIIYERTTDSLYLFGYLKGQPVDSWGVVGLTARRIDHWLAGKPIERFTIASLPTNPYGTDKGTPLTPESVAIAGDYLFLGMVKPENNVQYTHVLRTSDGSYVGSLAPGPEVGGAAGWQDMPYAITALKRTNGEYLVLVEEDWRGKNLLYRWRP